MSPPTSPQPPPLPPYHDETGQIHPRSGPFDPPVPEDGRVILAPGELGPYGYYEQTPGSGVWLPPP